MDSDSSIECLDSDHDERLFTATQSTQKGRKNIRTVKEVKDLGIRTRLANTDEDERIKRIESLNEKFKLVLGDAELEGKLVLEYDFENKAPSVSVHEKLSNKLKSHQKEGVKFMWNACYESLEQIKNSNGSGCILAHCMGLGKTLQVVTLVHTLLSHKETRTETVLICCPKNTLLNWINEFSMWISSDMGSIKIYNLAGHENQDARLEELTMWQVCGGVCITNYELFRILLDEEKTKGKQVSPQIKKLREHLLDPGPDLVICDEGHILKNEGTRLFKVMNQIRTLRRIVLTGTPMQNNLKEYHCMVQFVKPHLLGTRSEFLNMFVNPILNGQYENSLVEDVQLMKERSHVLHKKLLGCVQRFDLSVLGKHLPEKKEYVIFVPLTDRQIDMYRFFMKNYSANDSNCKNSASALFSDHQALQRIWTHPYAFKLYEEKHLKMTQEGGKKESGQRKRKKKKSMEDVEDCSESSEAESFQWRKYPLSWWTRFFSLDDVENCQNGNKLILILKILKECEEAGEKLLLFSGSLYSLTTIEHFLKKINGCDFENPSLCNMTSTWEEGEDYLVLTGQTTAKDRDLFCKRFNNPNDSRLRLFLISTKAGGMGINLTAANRAVIFDVSWNPSHDTQSIFRIYRIGQTKPCFVYRFVASGTMEEKIYERQVAKQSISHRVVDELQTARHFTQTELLQLYKFEPYRSHKMNVSEVKDTLLVNVLNDSPGVVNGIHEHDSLLEHKEEEELKEAEKSMAWTAFNRDKDYEVLPDEVKSMLKELKPDSFDPSYLRIILEKRYPQLFNIEINEMMDELMPKIQTILKRPDFTEIMNKQALLYHKNQFAPGINLRKSKKSEVDDVIIIKDDEEDKEESIICLNPKPTTKIDKCFVVDSDSDDSVFIPCSRSKKKKMSKIKPIRSWGAINGKLFRSPHDST